MVVEIEIGIALELETIRIAIIAHNNITWKVCIGITAESQTRNNWFEIAIARKVGYLGLHPEQVQAGDYGMRGPVQQFVQMRVRSRQQTQVTLGHGK